LTTDLTGTATASDAGTDLFKAPEIEEGKYSNKCDLYSIGIILYLLKTGECIFEGKKKVEILVNKFNNKIKKETDDKLLNELIKKLVVIAPHERMEWNDYFNHPFFTVNEENEIKEEFEKKINY
jgi:serine/threonine protein kinase